MNIYQKIAEVQKECSYVKKDASVKAGGQSYRAVTHDAVLERVRDSVINHGILIIPSQNDKGVCIDGVTKSGTAKIRFEATYTIEFINIDDPQDKAVMCIEAHAEDMNDKAPGKGISYASKTAMLKMFLIKTGENDEERMEESMPQLNAFHYKQQLENCQDFDELVLVWNDIPKQFQKQVQSVKDDMKKKLGGENA